MMSDDDESPDIDPTEVDGRFIDLAAQLAADDVFMAGMLAVQQEAASADVVYAVLAMKREVAESIIEQWMHYEDHGCPVAAEQLDNVMTKLVHYLAQKLHGGPK